MNLDLIRHHFFNVEALERSWTVLSEGALATLRLGVVALLLALLVGAIIAAANLSPWKWMRTAAESYVDVMRAMPLLVALVLVFYLLPPLTGIQFQPFGAAAVTFGLMHGAFFAEVYRGGWLSVDRGQFEAADSLGLSRTRTVRMIVIPQLLRIIFPPMTSQMTLLLRDLPLAFIIGYFEVLNAAKAAQVFTANSTSLMAAMVIYAVMLMHLQWLTSVVERRSTLRAEG